MKKTSGKRSGKRLLQDPVSSEEKSHQTEVLDDLDLDLDLNLAEFQFEKKKDRKPSKTQKPQSPPKEHRKEKSLESDLKKLNIVSAYSSNQKQEREIPAKKQPSIMDFFNKGGKQSVQIPYKKKTPERTFLEDSRIHDKISSAFIKDNGVKSKTKMQIIEEPQQRIANVSVPKQIPNDQQEVQKGKSYKEMFHNKAKSPSKPLIKTIKGDQLKGQKFVISGLINVCSRDQLQQTLEDLGAKMTGNVSGVTNLLFTGEKLEDGRPVEQGNKYKTAVLRKTKIIRESQLSQWFQDLIGISIEDLFGESMVGKLFQQSFELMAFKDTPQTPTVQDSWPDKYSPKCLPDLVGHRSSIDQLASWLNQWGKKEDPSDQPKKNNFMMMQLGRFQITGDKHSKACIISGPPGIGKSSAVKLLAEVLNYQTLATNASEQRNKSSVKGVIGHLIGNKLLFNMKLHSKFIIIMDEVDGMTGSDRGGIQQLIECIKNTQVPIVCICNDNEHPKLRSLMAYCYHIKFSKPSVEQASERLLQICQSEKLKMSPEELIGVASTFDCDLRQSINFLQMMSFGKKNQIDKLNVFAKDQVSVMNAFQAALTLMNRDTRAQLRYRQKLDFFFLDYELMPLIIQDNYLRSMKKTQKPKTKTSTKKQTKTQEEEPKEDLKYEYSYEDIDKMAQAAECMALGDILKRSIRWKQNWALLPAYGILSTLQPCELVGEELGFPKFPEFLGKNSTQRRVTKEMSMLKNQLGPVTFNSSVKSMKFEYGPALFHMLDLILRKKFAKTDDVAAWHAVELLENYNLTPEDFKVNLHNLMFNPQKLNLIAQIDASTKTVLTKLFNKRHQILKLQGKKAAKKKQEDKVETIIYNPALGEEGPIAIEQEAPDEDSQNLNNDVEEKPTSKKTKKVIKVKIEKNEKRAPKRKKIASSSEDESLGGFVVDDEDE